MQSDPPMPPSPVTASAGPVQFPLHVPSNQSVPEAAAAVDTDLAPLPPLPLAPSPAPVTDATFTADQLLQTSLARLTGGISPVSLGLAQADWAMHLLASPAKLQQLLHSAAGINVRLAAHAARSLGQLARPPGPPWPPPNNAPSPQERRFRHPSWRVWPYSLFQQSYLLNRQWWHNATSDVAGVAPHHARMVGLMAHQMLDLFAPSNNILTSPDVLDATLREGGQNFVRGTINLLKDLDSEAQHLPPPGAELFVPGKQVALTRGKVILRHRLFELLQYQPLTDDVYPLPLLVVPAWDSKYYLLDLSRSNSLVSHLVHRSHTVFLISWRNPPAAEPDWGPDNYLSALAAAATAVHSIVPGQAINAVGYGTGATLLTLAAAHEHAPPFASLSLLLPQTDFTPAAELAQRTGGSATARAVHDYLLGQRDPLTDVEAWHADRPRVPYRMQREQFRALLPDADLGTGRLRLRGRTLALHTVRAPLFVLAAEHARALPWHGTYQLKRAFDTDLTFVLANGDQGAALLGTPGTDAAHFRLGHWRDGARHDDAPRWYDDTSASAGSWWPAWLDWLASQSPAAMAEPPVVGAPELGYPVLGPAPGRYVLEH